MNRMTSATGASDLNELPASLGELGGCLTLPIPS
jgi:hypothetical protein